MFSVYMVYGTHAGSLFQTTGVHTLEARLANAVLVDVTATQECTRRLFRSILATPSGHSVQRRVVITKC